MTTPISNNSPRFDTCTPEETQQPVCTGPAPQPSPVAPTSVLQCEPRQHWDGAVVGDDSRTEAFLREQFTALDPSESYELSGAFGVKAEVALDYGGSLKVERQPDSSFVVEVKGQGELGVAVPFVASGKAGLAAGTKFHVDTAGEAADLCDALIKASALSATGVGAQVADLAHDRFGVKGDVVDARSRALAHLQHVSEVRGEQTASSDFGAEVKVPGFEMFSARAEGSVRGGVSYNFETGELRQTRTLGMSGTGSAKLLPAIADYGGQVRGTVSVNSVYKVPEELKSALRDGTMSALEVAAKLAFRPADAIEVKTELELNAKGRSFTAGDAKVKLKTEQKFDEKTFAGAKDIGDILLAINTAKWSVEADVGLGAVGAFDAGVVKSELVAVRRKRMELANSVDLHTAMRVAQEAAEQQSASDLDARRATSSLH